MRIRKNDQVLVLSGNYNVTYQVIELGRGGDSKKVLVHGCKVTFLGGEGSWISSSRIIQMILESRRGDYAIAIGRRMPEKFCEVFLEEEP